MKHTVCDLDKKHIVPTSLTSREVRILTELSEYYESKSEFCRTLMQKNYALEISKTLKKTIKL